MLQNCDRIVTTQTAQYYNFVTKLRQLLDNDFANNQVPLS